MIALSGEKIELQFVATDDFIHRICPQSNHQTNKQINNLNSSFNIRNYMNKKTNTSLAAFTKKRRQ